MKEMASIEPDPSIGAVLFGFDLNLNYKKLAKAYTYLTSCKECLFLATNDDSTFPTGKRIYPGTGALLASLIKALPKERQEPMILGKPHATMLEVVVNKYVFL
jgi:4-nitrophenyl phosphatase